MRIHCIMLALNEQVFIKPQLSLLYKFCSGISVITQYDRDWYNQPVVPDSTLELVTSFPDPERKIHLVLRRFPDEAAARNSEMLAVSSKPHRRIMSHGSSEADIRAFHDVPDYFFIVDADEIYDDESLPRIIDYLSAHKPRGMRIHGYNYVRSWNHRVPREVVRFCHFGFLRRGVLFKMRRTVTWNESRFAKLLAIARLPDVSARLWGFLECPPDIGMFHHGCWLGDSDRLTGKARRSSHQEINKPSYLDEVSALPSEYINTADLPRAIRDADWPIGYLDRDE